MSNTAPINTVLITGCSRGIGLCTAQLLKQRGYRVFATARKSEDILNLQKLGLETERLDLIDTQSIDTAVNNILQKTGGRLDALINNAGYPVLGAVEDLSINAFKEQFETNFFGTVYLTNKIIPIMRQQTQGRIIFISSVSGYAAMPYTGAYTASKFALEGLTETLALELIDSSIQVSLIEPGFIETDIHKDAQLPLITNSPHQRSYDQFKKLISDKNRKKHMPFIKPPSAVVKKIIHALEKKSPKFRYRITVLAHLSFISKFLLPGRLQLRLVSNAMKNILRKQLD